VDITRDEIAVRVWRDGEVIHYRRIKPDSPKASNQPMERTATRRALTVRVASGPPPRATHALGGRRSSLSR
jgi:hypothetical protein